METSMALHSQDMGNGYVKLFRCYKRYSQKFKYATDILIRIAGDSKIYSYQNITKVLSLQVEIDEANERLETATTEEAKLLVERIAEKEQEKKIYLDKAQSFIRKYAQLRYQPILDPQQESIKRSRIFDGTLIIDGGPGTGNPAHTENRMPIENSITLKRRLDPKRLKDKRFLKDNWNDLVAYMESTSLDGNPSLLQRIRIFCLRTFKHLNIDNIAQPTSFSNHLKEIGKFVLSWIKWFFDIFYNLPFPK